MISELPVAKEFLPHTVSAGAAPASRASLAPTKDSNPTAPTTSRRPFGIAESNATPRTEIVPDVAHRPSSKESVTTAAAPVAHRRSHSLHPSSHAARTVAPSMNDAVVSHDVSKQVRADVHA